MPKGDDEKAPDCPDAVPASVARRKLLKLGAYVAPAVIGALLIGPDAEAATTKTCTPNGCTPPPPCGPRP